MKRKHLVIGLIAGGLLVVGAQAAAASGTTGSKLVSEGISLELGKREVSHRADAVGQLVELLIIKPIDVGGCH